MKLELVAAVAVLLAVSAAGRADEPVVMPPPVRDVSGRTPEQAAQRRAERRTQIEQQIARIDQEAQRMKDVPEAAALAEQMKSTLRAMLVNAEAQADASQAGDLEKVRTLIEQGRELEAASGATAMAMNWTRQAYELRAMTGKIPPATGDAEPARQSYIGALNALADFYTAQAQNPTGTLRAVPREVLEAENALKLSREQARIEFDYQNALAQIKTTREQFADYADTVAACDALTQQAGAVRDAQRKAAEAQAELGKALAAQAAAAATLDKARQAAIPALRQKAQQR